jgi:hypothetical protein
VKLRAAALCVVLALGTLGGAIAGGGSAAAAGPSGAYTITMCSPGTTAGSWTSVNATPASMTTGNQCGNGTPAIGPNNTLTEAGSLYGEDIIGSTTYVPNGGQAGWQLTVPNGVMISGISYYGSFETQGNGWLAGLMVDGQPLPNVCVSGVVTTHCDCRNNLDDPYPCEVDNNQLPQTESNLNATSIFFGVACDQVQNTPDCGPGSMLHDAEADMYSAQVTLTESTGPQLSAEGGPLWGASGPVWGTAPLTFTATDTSGIGEIDVLSPAGADIAVTPESCTYSQVQACPELPSGQVQVNTLGLPDGQQHISLRVTNAAGNTTVVQGPTVVIDNNGPPPPGNLIAAAASTTANVINLAWSDPTNPPEPVQDAYAELCQATCAGPTQISPSGGAQIAAPAAGAYTVRLWLTDTAGRGSSQEAATTTVTVPAPTTTTTTTTGTTTVTTPKPTCVQKRTCAAFKLNADGYAHGRLTLVIAKLPKPDHLRITLSYPHKRAARTITTSVGKTTITIVTSRPSRAVLEALDGTRQDGAKVTITKIRAPTRPASTPRRRS